MKKFLSRVLMQMALIGAMFGISTPAQAQGTGSARHQPKTVSIKFQVFSFNSAGWVHLFKGLGAEYRFNDAMQISLSFYRASPNDGVALYMGTGFESNFSRGRTGMGAEFGFVAGYRNGIIPAMTTFVRSGRRDQVSGRFSAITPLVSGKAPAVFNMEVRMPESFTNDLSIALKP